MTRTSAIQDLIAAYERVYARNELSEAAGKELEALAPKPGRDYEECPRCHVTIYRSAAGTHERRHELRYQATPPDPSAADAKTEIARLSAELLTEKVLPTAEIKAHAETRIELHKAAELLRPFALLGKTRGPLRWADCDAAIVFVAAYDAKHGDRP